MVSDEMSSGVNAPALAVAEALKKELEKRLVGKASGGFQIAEIQMPVAHPDQIAMWTLWVCRMVDSNNENAWWQGISAYIPRTELYPLFRQAFAGINIEVDHPPGGIYFDKTDGSDDGPPDRAGREFTGSGRTVVVTSLRAAYVQPREGPTNAVWLNAKILIYSNLGGQHGTGGPMLACTVNPFEFGFGRRDGRYCYLPEASERPTFYLWFQEAEGKDVYFPIARLVAVNKTNCEVTFELDVSVESFNPTVN